MQSNDTRAFCRCGCGRPVKSGHRFLTGSHMRRFSPVEKFWLYVIKHDGGCWEWIGPTDGDEGYGRLMTDGERTRAHQFSWVLHFGPIPDGMDVLHRCDNPPCPRPDHLFLGDQADNNRDRHNKGRYRPTAPERRARGERVGTSKLHPADVVLIRQQHATGVSIYRLAQNYSVSWATVSAIVKRQKWAHI